MSARTSRRSGSAFALSVLLFSGIFSGNAPRLLSQTATLTSFGAGAADTDTGLILASDGNFYGVTSVPSGFGYVTNWTCNDNPANECNYIDKITPGGTSTPLYTFEQAPGDTTTPYGPSPLVEGSDGNFYGTTSQGGSSGYGTVFRVTPSGTLTVLANFGGGPLTLASDGNLYGVTAAAGGIALYQVTTGGAVTVLPNATPVSPGGGIPYNNPPLQGTDGNFYIITGSGLLQITISGAVTVVYPYPLSSTEVPVPGPSGPLVEGSDGNFYATAPYTTVNSDGTNPGNGAVYRFTPTGSLQTLYTFSGGTDGNDTNPDLSVGSDGNLYGTTYYGGNPSCPSNMGTLGIPGCGTIFEIGISGGFHSLYSFNGTAVDGGRPYGQLVQDETGSFYGTTFANYGNTVFDLTLTPALPAPIQLSFNPATVAPGSPTTLTWNVLNAYSLTMQQCYAFIQSSPAGAGSWTGLQTGKASSTGFGGSTIVTPTVAGTYTYALTCGGRESGFATLKVGLIDEITTTTLADATVGTPYSATLAATGGIPPYTWSVIGTAPAATVSNGAAAELKASAGPIPLAAPVPTLPAGLTLNSATGVISGTPTQFENENVTFQALDSSTPPNQATATLPVTVQSSLKIITTSLVKGTVNGKYLQALAATGGIGPYVWTITAGTLPQGLSLSVITGQITGKATTAGTTSLTLQVSDFETTPATATVTLNLVIAPTVQIAAVEFTQVIQQYQTVSDLLSSLSTYHEPPVPMVTGKPAVMRIYFTAVNDATTVNVAVTGSFAGTRPLSLTPGCLPTDARAQVPGCPSMDFYFTPPTGTWTIILTLNDDKGNQLEQETFPITSRDNLQVNLTAVSVCSRVSDPTSCQNPVYLFGLTEFANLLLPTNAVNLTFTLDKVTNNLSSFANTQSWIQATNSKLNTYYSASDRVNDVANDTRTDYIGLYSSTIDTTGVGYYTGHALLVPSSAPRLGVESIRAVVAHEIGHTLGLVHTQNPNPLPAVPNVAPGCWGPGAGIPGVPTNWKYFDNNVQSSAGLEYGFNVASQKAVDPNVDYDIMSYCVNRWISPLNYKRAFFYLDGQNAVASPSLKGTQGEPMVPSDAEPLAAPVLVEGSYWQVSGTIASTGVTLDPIFTQTINGSTDPGTGTYSIQAQSATGQALYTRYFTPLIDTTDTLGADIISDPQFSEWIPATAGTAAIAFFDPNGNLLTSVPLTGVPPTVTITSPLTGFVGSGQQTVSWTIQSATATSFTSRIFYSIDGGTTWQQVDEVPGTSDILDFSTLPGATAAMFRIDVSDGVNTGSATSVPFSVPKKLPSAIVINNPVSGAIQPAANPVYLDGEAYDADDGVLTGTALQWTDSAQGALGSGSPLTVNLNPGNHTITLTGTDSDGNAITATTQITLAGDPPALSLATTQVGTNCINATVNATPGAEGAGLTRVNYSLDGGATYTAIPLTGLPFTFSVPGSGAINLVAVAIDASGQSSAQSAELNLGTGCAVTPPAEITPTVTVTPSPTSITTAQPLTVTISVSGGSGNPTPTGSVTLSSGSYTSAATTLVSGGVTITIPAGSLPASTDTLTATYTPDSGSSSTYNSATGSNTVTVTTAPPASFTLSNSGNITFGAGSGTGNTATISVAPSNGFTGAVNLTCAVTTTPANPTSPATCAVTPSVTISGTTVQNATLTVNTTTSTTTGAYAVTVSGTSGAISMPTTVGVTVSANVAPTFTLSSGGAITISSPGATTGNTTTISVIPGGGFTGNVILSAAVATAPSGATDPPTFSFGATSPVDITGATAGTGTLTVTTTAPAAAFLIRPKSNGAPWYAVGGATLACLLLVGIPASRRRWKSMLGLLALLAILTGGLAGCVHKSGSGRGTTAGSYTITVTGTSGSIAQTTTVTLTVN